MDGMTPEIWPGKSSESSASKLKTDQRQKIHTLDDPSHLFDLIFFVALFLLQIFPCDLVDQMSSNVYDAIPPSLIYLINRRLFTCTLLTWHLKSDQDNYQNSRASKIKTSFNQTSPEKESLTKQCFGLAQYSLCPNPEKSPTWPLLTLLAPVPQTFFHRSNFKRHILSSLSSVRMTKEGGQVKKFWHLIK